MFFLTSLLTFISLSVAYGDITKVVILKCFPVEVPTKLWVICECPSEYSVVTGDLELTLYNIGGRDPDPNLA